MCISTIFYYHISGFMQDPYSVWKVSGYVFSWILGKAVSPRKFYKQNRKINGLMLCIGVSVWHTVSNNAAPPNPFK